MPARNTLVVQLLALYTNVESQNAQRRRQADDDYANSWYHTCSSTIG